MKNFNLYSNYINLSVDFGWFFDWATFIFSDILPIFLLIIKCNGSQNLHFEVQVPDTETFLAICSKYGIGTIFLILTKLVSIKYKTISRFCAIYYLKVIAGRVRTWGRCGTGRVDRSGLRILLRVRLLGPSGLRGGWGDAVEGLVVTATDFVVEVVVWVQDCQVIHSDGGRAGMLETYW